MKHDQESHARWLRAAETIVSSSSFKRLYRRRERVRWGLTCAALAVAGGFTASMCLLPGFLAARVSPEGHVTWGVVLTVLCFVLGVSVGAIYVFAAERLLGTETLGDGTDHDH